MRKTYINCTVNDLYILLPGIKIPYSKWLDTEQSTAGLRGKTEPKPGPEESLTYKGWVEEEYPEKSIKIQERQKKVQKEWHGNQGKKVFRNRRSALWCEMLLKYQVRQAYVCQIQVCRGVKQSGKPADHNWRGQGEGNTERKKERVSRGGGSSQVWRAYIPC